MTRRNEIASALLTLLDREKADRWKDPDMLNICKLAVEYLTLEGLEDATRASQIPLEIYEIITEGE